MTKATSFSGMEINLIQFLLGHIIEHFAIREIARHTGIDYKMVHSAIQKLVQKEVIIKRRQANIDLCSLNLKGDLTGVYYAEMLRAKEFLARHSDLTRFFRAIHDRVTEIYYTIVIFGSVAKGTQNKESDIDILIVTPLQSTSEEIDRIIHTEAITLRHKVQTIVLSQTEFIRNLSSNQPNVVIEAFKNHIIITGIEGFYNGVKKAR